MRMDSAVPSDSRFYLFLQLDPEQANNNIERYN